MSQFQVTVHTPPDARRETDARTDIHTRSCMAARRDT